MDSYGNGIELALSPSVFESLRSILLTPEKCLVGGLRRNRTQASSSWILHQASLQDRSVSGVDFPPLSGYAMILSDDLRAISWTSITERLAPKRSQSWIILVFDRNNDGDWDGIQVYDGSVLKLDGLRVAGARMLHVRRKDLESEQREQSEWPEAREFPLSFSRVRCFFGQDLFGKVQQSVVTLVGASRNGTLAAQYLASQGVQRFRLIDPGVLGEENLDGMPGIPLSRIGESKVKVLGESLMEHQRDMVITTCERSVIDPEGVKFLKNSHTDLLVSCVDNDVARVAVAQHAHRLLVPHLDLATSVLAGPNGEVRIFGDARLFLPGQGCALCVPKMENDERHEILYALSAPATALARGTPRAWNEERLGSSALINAITVAGGIASWIDLLKGSLRTSLWQRFDWHSGIGLQTRASAIGPSENCICNESSDWNQGGHHV